MRVTLALTAVQPSEGVLTMGEREWKQGRQEEDNRQPHGHSHADLLCNLTEIETRETRHEENIINQKNYFVNGSMLFDILNM